MLHKNPLGREEPTPWRDTTVNVYDSPMARRRRKKQSEDGRSRESGQKRLPGRQPQETDGGGPDGDDPKKVQARLSRIYGERVSGKSWFALPDCLLGLFGRLLASDVVTVQEAYALIVLLRFEYNRREIRVGYERLSQYLGVKERRVRDIMNALEVKGLIHRRHSRLGLKNRANVYDLTGLHSHLNAIFSAWHEDETRRHSRRNSGLD